MDFDLDYHLILPWETSVRWRFELDCSNPELETLGDGIDETSLVISSA